LIFSLVGQKKSEILLPSVILVALTAHYASTLVLCNGTSCISLGLSSDHYVLF